MDVSNDVSILKGVGPKLLEKLNKCGIFTIMDLLLYFPRDYEFLGNNVPVNEISNDEKNVLTCFCMGCCGDVRTKTGKYLTTIRFNYNGTIIEGKWFNQRFIKNTFKIGEKYDLIGKFKKVGNKIEVVNPIVGIKVAMENEIVPKYSLKEELTDKILIKLISNCLENIKIKDNLPQEMIDKYKMVDLDFAVRNIHFPSGRNELEKAIIRLKFQELFTYSMKLLLLKRKLKVENGISFPWVKELGDLKAALPYSLTEAQTRVVREILRDQKSLFPMNRLVQGDVGSGKTVVALIAIFNVVKCGYQATLMVPTEILASQHYEEAKKLLGPFGIHIELLTGSTSAKEKRRIKEIITTETPMVVIGTHALIQEDVDFKNLGLVVTDEQHRFGVEQRNRLINKGRRPDVLVMTATPIPRTLALYVYSDLDISVIDKLPPGRKPVKTEFYNGDHRMLAYDLALDEIRKGRQVYIVCPLIEEDEKLSLNSVEKLYDELKDALQNVMDKDSLDVETLQGFTLNTHSDTGIQYLVKDGEEGRGGKVLLQNEADRKRYEELAEMYFDKYPNLIESREEGFIWADLEIRGMAKRTDQGIISIGADGMSYSDNENYKNNWSVRFSGSMYEKLYEWLQNNKDSMEEIHKFSTWQKVFDEIGGTYERVWSKEELDQGYLNN